MTDFYQRIDNLSPKKRELLALRVKKQLATIAESDSSTKRLTAYVVPAPNQFPTTSEMRDFLRGRLPDYMVPSTFVILDTLPLLPNGKVDRKSLSDLEPVWPEFGDTFVEARTPVEKTLAGIWAQVLGFEEIGVHDNFFEVGGDSILSIQIIARANQVGLHLTPNQLFQHQTIAELAAVTGTADTIEAEQGPVTGAIPLTPIQHWFFEQDDPEPHHWNQAFLLEVPRNLDLTLLQRAIQQLLLHHDALRLHFAHEGSGWQQFMAGGDVAVSLDRVDVSVLSYPEQRSTIEVTATELQASLNLAEAPLMRATFFDLGTDRPSRLLIIIHHLAVDSVSWRVLLEDLEAIYRRLSRGETISLPPKTTSYKQWSETLTEYARSVDVRRGLDYWLAAPRSEIERVGIPVDNADSNANTRSSARTLAVSLDVEETQVLLQEVPAVYNTQINDVLLTALVQSFSQWTGVGSLMVGLEGHGREAIVEGIDLSRTVGWFTSFFPVTLDLGEVSNTGDALKRIKEQLRRVPDRGIGYGVLRYLSGDGGIIGKLASLPQPEVLFNYGGQLDQILPGSSLFRLARESIGPAQSLQGKRSHLLEINALVVEDRLQLNWAYSEKVHRRATIEKLAENFVKSLRSLIAHCLSPEAGGYTPSDFPDADLNQEVLDDLIADLDESIE